VVAVVAVLKVAVVFPVQADLGAAARAVEQLVILGHQQGQPTQAVAVAVVAQTQALLEGQVALVL
jgi:hypothetical protein